MMSPEEVVNELRAELDRVTKDLTNRTALFQSKIARLESKNAELVKFRKGALHEVGEAIVYIRRKVGDIPETDSIMAASAAAVETIVSLRQENADYCNKLADVQSQLEQLRAQYNETEPCGHTKNFLIGDEHGHFTCTVCHIAALKKENADLNATLARACRP